MRSTHISVLAALSFASCTPTSGIEDGADDAFLQGGKADESIDEDSAEARAVLELVNTASESTLVNTVGLSQSVATNIFAYRVGDDGEEGTEDDDRYDTLAELDSVPLVGSTVFAALREYAGAGCSGGDSTSAGGVDLGGVFLTATGVSTVPWDRIENSIGPRLRNMHFLPGVVPHGTTLVIALEQGYSDLPESLTNAQITREEFEAYWGVTLGSKVIYRRANVVPASLPPGDAEITIARIEETGIPYLMTKASVSSGQCRSFDSPNATGVRRPSLPGSATPGRANVQPGATGPFITEICWKGPFTSPTEKGYSYVEIYVP